MDPSLVTGTSDLALVSVSRGKTHLFRLREGTSLVGRGSECEIILTSNTVSRKHAELTVENGRLTVKDLKSRNGTFIDHQKITSGVVEQGQRVKFGVLAFVLQNVDGMLANVEVVETVRVPGGLVEERSSRSDLTEAQCRVYDLLVTGKSEKEIARLLHLSPNTIHCHVQAIYATFDVHTRAELMAIALN